MNSQSRHRVVHSLSLSMLQQQVTALLREGWITLGTPALAQPVDRSCPACWVQALYFRAQPEQDLDLPSIPAQPGSSLTGSRVGRSLAPPRGAGLSRW